MSGTPVKLVTVRATASNAARTGVMVATSAAAGPSDENLRPTTPEATGRDTFEGRPKSRRRRGGAAQPLTPSPPKSPDHALQKPQRAYLNTQIPFLRDGRAFEFFRRDAIDPTTLETFGHLARDAQEKPYLLATMPASLPHLAPHVVSIPRDDSWSLATFLPHMEASWITRATNPHCSVHFYLLLGEPATACYVGTLADAYAALGQDIDGDRERGQWVRICYEASKGIPEYLLVVAHVLTAKRYRSLHMDRDASRRVQVSAKQNVSQSGEPMRQVLHRALIHAIDAHLHHAVDCLLESLEQEGGITNEMRAEQLAAVIASCNSSTLQKLLSRPRYEVNMHYKGMPLLHHAAAQSTAMTKLLLNHHADAHARDAMGLQAHRYTNDVERRRVLSRAALQQKPAGPTTP